MSAICYVCGSECEGTTGAVIDDVFQPMCHDARLITCYMAWQRQYDDGTIGDYLDALIAGRP